MEERYHRSVTELASEVRKCEQANKLKSDLSKTREHILSRKAALDRQLAAKQHQLSALQDSKADLLAKVQAFKTRRGLPSDELNNKSELLRR
jgi:chromosome segregation ATPase